MHAEYVALYGTEGFVRLLAAHTALLRILDALIRLNLAFASGVDLDHERMLNARQQLLDELARHDLAELFSATERYYRQCASEGQTEMAGELRTAWDAARARLAKMMEVEAQTRDALMAVRDALLAQVTAQSRGQSVRRYGADLRSAPRFLDGVR